MFRENKLESLDEEDSQTDAELIARKERTDTYKDLFETVQHDLPTATLQLQGSASILTTLIQLLKRN